MISAVSSIDAFTQLRSASPVTPAPPVAADSQPELREAFDSFVGEAFYGQMLKAMRQTVKEPAYFHGGRTEEVFREHLDQVLAQEMTKANASDFTGPMFELFNLSRS